MRGGSTPQSRAISDGASGEIASSRPTARGTALAQRLRSAPARMPTARGEWWMCSSTTDGQPARRRCASSGVPPYSTLGRLTNRTSGGSARLSRRRAARRARGDHSHRPAKRSGWPRTARICAGATPACSSAVAQLAVAGGDRAAQGEPRRRGEAAADRDGPGLCGRMDAAVAVEKHAHGGRWLE